MACQTNPAVRPRAANTAVDAPIERCADSSSSVLSRLPAAAVVMTAAHVTPEPSKRPASRPKKAPNMRLPTRWRIPECMVNAVTDRHHSPARTMAPSMRARRNPDWQGKVAVVTGASSGIGEAIAKKFSREGLRVVLVARSRERLERVAKQLRALGGEALVVVADLTQEEERLRVFEEVRAACTPVIWSRGVELQRAGAVQFDRSDDEEVVFRIAARGGMISRAVQLFH